MKRGSVSVDCLGNVGVCFCPYIILSVINLKTEGQMRYNTEMNLCVILNPVSASINLILCFFYSIILRLCPRRHGSILN
jgi:hypothetical protein